MKKFFTVLILIAIAGCGTETSTVTDEEQVLDPFGDPPGYAGDPFAGYGPVTSINLPADGEPYIQEAVASGLWSIQTAACGSMEAALSLRDVLASKTDQPIFIDNVGSYFKVRVGAFSSAEESAGLRVFLRSNGYPDAWSVEREPTP